MAEWDQPIVAITARSGTPEQEQHRRRGVAGVVRARLPHAGLPEQRLQWLWSVPGLIGCPFGWAKTHPPSSHRSAAFSHSTSWPSRCRRKRSTTGSGRPIPRRPARDLVSTMTSPPIPDGRPRARAGQGRPRRCDRAPGADRHERHRLSRGPLTALPNRPLISQGRRRAPATTLRPWPPAPLRRAGAAGLGGTASATT